MSISAEFAEKRALFCRCLLVLLVVCCAGSPAVAGEVPGFRPAGLEEDVRAEGVGANEREAVEDAFRNAIQIGIGLYVDNETVLENKTLIKDRILISSKGYIDTYELLSKQNLNGLVKVSIQAVVKIQDVKDKLASLNIATLKLEGSTNTYARLATKLQRSKEAEAVLIKEFSELFGTKSVLEILEINLGDFNIDESKLAQDGTVPLVVNFTISINADSYGKRIEALSQVLNNLGATVDGRLRLSFDQKSQETSIDQEDFRQYTEASHSGTGGRDRESDLPRLGLVTLEGGPSRRSSEETRGYRPAVRGPAERAVRSDHARLVHVRRRSRNAEREAAAVPGEPPGAPAGRNPDLGNRTGRSSLMPPQSRADSGLAVTTSQGKGRHVLTQYRFPIEWKTILPWKSPYWDGVNAGETIEVLLLLKGENNTVLFEKPLRFGHRDGLRGDKINALQINWGGRSGLIRAGWSGNSAGIVSGYTVGPFLKKSSHVSDVLEYSFNMKLPVKLLYGLMSVELKLREAK